MTCSIASAARRIIGAVWTALCIVPFLSMATAAHATPPTAPGNLTATAQTSSRIYLTWTAATDDGSVAYYYIERCQGANCSNFAVIGNPPGSVTNYTSSSLQAVTSYSYRVRARDNQNEFGPYSNVASATTLAADTTPPTAPSGLTATAVGGSRIDLAWTPSTDNVGVTSYRLDRCAGVGCTFSQSSYISGTSAFPVVLLNANTSYSFRLRAQDAEGNLSAYSGVATATTGDATIAPTALVMTAVTQSSISLSWTASAGDVAFYQVHRCQGAGCTNFSYIAQVNAGTSVGFSGLQPGTSYSFRVRAQDHGYNVTAYTNVATATTLEAADTTPPTAPTGLTATAVSASQINLSWTASTDNVGVTGYRVERCQGAGCSGFAQVAAPTGTSHSSTALTPGTSYSFRVRATDGAGNLSQYSAVASATTPGAPQAQVYFIHADHLNTPRLVADATGTTVWRWDQQEPFGSNPADENPSGLGAFDLPLRLPGQYYDRETNLHYNVLRDYDANLGNYKQSDSLGLYAGLNTYAYVGGRPLEFIDPTGEGAIGVCVAVAVGAAAIYGGYNLISALNSLGQSAAAQGSSAVQCVATSDQSVCTQAQINQVQTYQNAAGAAAAAAGMGKGFPSSKPTSPSSVGPAPAQPRYPVFPSNAGNSGPYAPGYNRSNR